MSRGLALILGAGLGLMSVMLGLPVVIFWVTANNPDAFKPVVDWLHSMGLLGGLPFAGMVFAVTALAGVLGYIIGGLLHAAGSRRGIKRENDG